MLGIQPGTVSPQPGSGLPPSPANSPSPYQPPLSPRPAHATARTLSEGGIELPDGRHDHHDKLRKHHRYVCCPYNAGGDDLSSGRVAEFIISRYLKIKINHMPVILGSWIPNLYTYEYYLRTIDSRDDRNFKEKKNTKIIY